MLALCKQILVVLSHDAEPTVADPLTSIATHFFAIPTYDWALVSLELYSDLISEWQWAGE